MRFFEKLRRTVIREVKHDPARRQVLGVSGAATASLLVNPHGYHPVNLPGHSFLARGGYNDDNGCLNDDTGDNQSSFSRMTRDQVYDHLLEHGIPWFREEQLREQAKNVKYFDADILVNRSMSYATKLRIQAERNFDMLQEQEFATYKNDVNKSLFFKAFPGLERWL